MFLTYREIRETIVDEVVKCMGTTIKETVVDTVKSKALPSFVLA